MDTLLTNPARLRKVVIIGFWVLYALALFTPVANDGGGAADYRIGVMLGFLALAFGWIPPSTIPWSANILVLVGWLFFWRRELTAAMWFGVAAAIAGLTAPWLSDASMGRLLIGYYLWQASLLLFAWGIFMLRRIDSDSVVAGTGAPERSRLVDADFDDSVKATGPNRTQ
jgi:hypothetical protein